MPPHFRQITKFPVCTSHLRAHSGRKTKSEGRGEPFTYAKGEAGPHVGEEITESGVLRHGVTDADLCQDEDVVSYLIVV